LRRMTPKRIANSARHLVASSPGWRRNVNKSSRRPYKVLGQAWVVLAGVVKRMERG
jgi:hypothetical protein